MLVNEAPTFYLTAFCYAFGALHDRSLGCVGVSVMLDLQALDSLQLASSVQ